MKIHCSTLLEIELQDINRLRESYNLPIQRRIDLTLILNLPTKVFKPIPECKSGETGELNKDTVLSEAIEVM